MGRLTVLGALLCCLLGPQTGTAETLVLKAAGALDVDDGHIVRPGIVVIEGERIASVRGDGPADARVIDLGDLVLLPGLIDAHVHLSLDLEPGYRFQPVTENAALVPHGRNAEEPAP